MDKNNMSHDDKRAVRRALINIYLQKRPYPLCKRDNPFFMRDLTSMVRNSEVYRFGKELKTYG